MHVKCHFVVQTTNAQVVTYPLYSKMALVIKVYAIAACPLSPYIYNNWL